MRIQQLDQIPDEALDLSQFLAVDDPSQTFKMTLLQLRDFMAAFFNAQYLNKGGDSMAGPLGVVAPANGNSSIFGNTLGGLFANMETHPAVLDTGSVTNENAYSPVWKGRYVHNAGWDGVYSWGILNKGAANAGSFTLAHLNGSGGEDWQWNFDGSTGGLKAKGAGFIAHDPTTGWQVQLCATGNAPRWDVLTSDGTVRARLDWYEPAGAVSLRNYLHNRTLYLDVNGLNSTGPVFTHEAQPTNANSLTRKDYVDEHKARYHGDGGGNTYYGLAAPGKYMCTVILYHGGRWYPLTFPMASGQQVWIRERGGENADRDYDFGVAITYDGWTLGLSSIQGVNAPGLPGIGPVACW